MKEYLDDKTYRRDYFHFPLHCCCLGHSGSHYLSADLLFRQLFSQPRRFDVSNWTLFTARVAGRRVGGATVAFDTPGLTMLEGRRDLAVLWDVRVSPEARGMGIGTALFERVEAWAKGKGCCLLKVETQNINVRACAFYACHGCEL